MGIPLVALSTQAPPSPLEQAGKVMQLKALAGQQQVQQAQLTGLNQENQQRQLEMADNEKLRQAYIDAAGDPDKVIQNISKAGVGPKALASAYQLKASQIDMQTKFATMQKDQLANTNTQNDMMATTAQSILALPVEQRRPALQKALGGLAQSGGIPPQQAQAMIQQAGQMSDQQLEDDLKVHVIASNKGKDYIASELAKREEQDKAAQLQLERDRFNATLPGGPLEAPDKAQQAAWLARPENKGKDAADFLSWKAKQSPMAMVMGNMLNAPAGAANPALDQAAERYASTGEITPGFGRSPGTTAAIIKRAAELHPDQSLAANSAEYKANTGSLKNLQKNADVVNAFENTALKNIDQVMQIAKNIPDLGVRFANIPVRQISAKMIGDENMSRLRTALASAQAESAKVLTSANASGVLSDSARKDAQDFLDGNLPFKSMAAQAAQLHTDFENRRVSYAQQIADIKKRLGGGAQQPNSPVATHRYNQQTGQIEEIKP